MKNQVEQKMLIERIGIDKSTISGFSLSSIDDERFRQKAKQEKGKIWYTTNSESSIELIDERKIGELLIESKLENYILSIRKTMSQNRGRSLQRWIYYHMMMAIICRT